MIIQGSSGLSPACISRFETHSNDHEKYGTAELSEYQAIFQDFVDVLWTANDETGLRELAARTATKLGFSSFAYLEIGEGPPILISSYPRAWTDHYFRSGYERLDPVVTTARKHDRIFAWGERGTRTDHKRFFGEAADFGIRNGLTVPIRSGSGRFAALTLATDTGADLVAETVTAADSILHLIGLYYHARVNASLTKSWATKPSLSPREIQCLIWASRGKSMPESAAILGVSLRTVTFHLENARTKLGATTVAQAVGMAVRQGLIP